jgi:hypothetical protein
MGAVGQKYSLKISCPEVGLARGNLLPFSSCILAKMMHGPRSIVRFVIRPDASLAASGPGWSRSRGTRPTPEVPLGLYPTVTLQYSSATL